MRSSTATVGARRYTVKRIGPALLLAILISACAPATSLTPQYQHFSKSIDYKNQATRILNKDQSPGVISKEDMLAVVDLTRQALAEAKLVDIDQLNRDYKDFGTHYRDEFIRGLKLFLDGYDSLDNKKNLEGQVLDDQWGTWYRQNADGIRRNVR